MCIRDSHESLVSQNPSAMEKAIAEMENQKAWDLENEMKQILSQLKITDLSAKMGKLSGGQIKRCLLYTSRCV